MLSKNYKNKMRAILHVAMLGMLGTAATAAELGEGAILLENNQGVRFRVYSPNADSVAVAGQFNNWSTSANPMVIDSDGYWEATVTSARANHQYKFVVNGDLWRKDPWSLQVENSSDGANSIVVDLNAYEWSPESDAFETPRIEDTVIYQLHLGSFMYHNDGLSYQFGNVFNDFVDSKLDYLEDLGVNVIHVMPMQEFPGERSWGYNTVFFHAPESSYGSPQDFQRLVDECHKRGIAVVVGIVYNHTAGNENVHFWDFDGNATSPDGGNGDFYYPDERALTWWGPEPDWSKTRTRERFLDNIRLFIEDYRINGIRMDAVGFMRKESSDGNDYSGYSDENGWSFLREFNNVARSYQDGRFISIAEDIASESAITLDADQGGAGFLSQWAETNLRDIMAASDDSDRNMDDILKILGYWYPVNYGFHELLKYHSSHDKVGSLNDGLRLPSLIGDESAWYTRSRSKLANGIIFNAAGTPMIFMGDEFYETGSWSDGVGEGLNWDNLAANQDIYEYNRDLIRLKLDAEALSYNNLEIPAVDHDEKLVSWRRWGESGEVIVYVANLSFSAKPFNVPFPSSGRWHHVINSNWIHYGGTDENQLAFTDVSNNNATITVPAYSMIALSQSLEIAPGRVWDSSLAVEDAASITDAEVQWRGTSRAESYDVYFSPDEAAVLQASTTSGEFLGATTTTSMAVPDGLQYGVPYFWRVDSTNSEGKTVSKVFREVILGEDVGSSGRVSWTPAQPFAGNQILISYDAAGGLLNGSSAMDIHVGFRVEGTDWVGTTTVPMTALGGGVFSRLVSIPANAEAVNCVFRNQADSWDNNSGNDWMIEVQAVNDSVPGDTFIVY